MSAYNRWDVVQGRRHKFFVVFFVFIFALSITLQLVSSGIQPARAAIPGEVVINEFSSASDTEWVELLNTTGDPISLYGWTIKDIANDPKSLSDLGTIPARGIVVFENPSGWLNNDPDPTETITIFDSADTPIHSVTYGDGEVDVSAPDAGESAYLLALPSTWAIAGTTPTKGWFNVAQEFNCETLTPPLPPTLISIQDCLEEEEGIVSNIGEMDNPSATPSDEDDGALYFRNDEGKIVFEQTLNLTDEAIVDVLQELGEKMDMSEGLVSFNSETADAMATMGAKIYMYGLDELGFTSEPSIIVKDDEGNVIGPEDDDYPDIDSDYDEKSGTLVFTAEHFTQFEVEMGSISGYKWNDLNGNGIRDWNDEDGNEEKNDGEEYAEPGIEGWTIESRDGESTQTTLTDDTGFYSFPSLPDGEYLVCEVFERNPDGTVVDGWMQTYPPENPEDYCNAGQPTGHRVVIDGGKTDADSYDFGNWTGEEEHNLLTVYKYNYDSEAWISEWEI